MKTTIKNHLLSLNNRLAMVAGLAVSAGMAHAETDLTAVTAAGVAVAAIGAAVFAVKVGGRVFKWMASAL
jgi:hypothetical protein